MPLDTNKDLGKGGIGMHTTGRGTAEYMLRQLQQQKIVVLAGAAADTNITVTGIKVGDIVQTCVEFTPSTSIVDLTSNVTITADDTIQIDVDTTGDDLFMVFLPDVPL